MPGIGNNMHQRIAGLADELARGELPLAIGRFHERDIGGVPRLHGDGSSREIELAFHVVADSIEPAVTARQAGVRVARLALEAGYPTGPIGGPSNATTGFPYAAALQATDGQWYTARLQPHLAGAPYANQQLAGSVLNNAEPVVTRLTDRLALIARESAGFPFRYGADSVAVKRPNFSAEGFLGDGYQPAVVALHLSAARDAADGLARRLDEVATRPVGLLRRRDSVTGADLQGVSTARAATWNSLMQAEIELTRLLPHELGLAPLDDTLHVQVAHAREAVRLARAALDDAPHVGMPQRTSFTPIRLQLDEAIERVRSLPDAPVPRTTGSASGSPGAPLPEFEALLERLRSGNWITRNAAMRVFEYRQFGRTAAERMRNFGVAMETLDAHVGFGDRGVYRLKGWLRDLADDAAIVRRELAPEHRDLDVLLARVEEYARRNGADGVVINAHGVAGYEDFPDFAEVGAIGASLRTYLAIDDAGRAVPATTTAPATDLVRW